MFVPRTKKEILNSQIDKLVNNTLITNFSDGSRAKTILELVDDDIVALEQMASDVLVQCTLSKSYGAYVDMIGELVSCKRLPGETDDNYKYRIANQVYTAASCNELALKILILATEGVKSVKAIPYTLGTGSFSVYVIPQNTNELNDVIARVQSLIDRKAGYGIRAIALSPTMVPVKMTVRLITTANANIESLRQSTRQAIRMYIESLDMGETLVINQLEHAILSISSDIVDVEIHSLELNDRPVLINNQKLYWDEKFSAPESNITVI